MFVIPLALIVLFAGILIEIPEAPGAAGMLLLAYAAVTSLAALLCLPVGSGGSRGDLWQLLLGAATAALVFLAAAGLDAQTRTAMVQALPLALTVFLLVIAALLPLLAWPRHAGSVRHLAFLLVALLMAAPVWLAPLAGQAGYWQGAPNVIAAISPLTAFASALELDYLRSRWFYEHSVLGSMRYAYPSWGAYVGALLVLIATGAGAAWRAGRDELLNVTETG